MSFDKIKVMRNAERFLSQGKIRAAINEYQRVVENDPKDFSTMNILGDLYVKNSDSSQAVGCFTQVAEHYNKQGFAHKAIAIYNKISRIEPDSIEISAKLAQLYQIKGSVVEARMHYNILAEQYERKGQMIEALTVWKKIAELDPNNTQIYLKIAEAYKHEDQPEEAAKAFTEAGLRLNEQKNFEQSIEVFTKALEVKKHYLRALSGLVKAQIGMGCADEAAKTLEDILEEQPYNRDILLLLIDCYIDLGNSSEAENAVVKLVEQEPASYAKFLDIVKINLKNGDLDGATRLLTISSEHLLIGGQSEDFLSWVNEILARNPEQIEAQRLLIQYYSWHRNEDELKNSLIRMAELAQMLGAIDDEASALSQLVSLLPYETGYVERLREIKSALGLEDDEAEIEAYSDQALNLETFIAADDFADDLQPDNADEFDFAGIEKSFAFEAEDIAFNNSSNGTGDHILFDETFASAYIEDASSAEPADLEVAVSELSIADELKLQKEIEGIEFYIAQGYKDLALKSLDALENEFGQSEELASLRDQIVDEAPIFADVEIEAAPLETIKAPVKIELNNSGFEILEELRNEFGFEDEAEEALSNDYETHYHLAVAYQEMGLMEDSIKEYQDAINCTSPDDGTRRFFKCSNLLGHCFMEKQMPNLALMWFKRCLEVSDLTDDEKQALFYELGNAYETGGDAVKAVEFFEKLYAENVDYRDVSQRLDNLK